MSFIADKQTLDDLNIPGRYKSDSIFHLFNRTQSRGGGLLLESMFQQPLSNAADINVRSSIFQFFRERSVAFPISKELCEAVEHYLSTAGSNSLPAAAIRLTGKKLMRLMASDQEYDLIQSGMLQVMKLLDQLQLFYSQLDPDGSSPWGTTIRKVQQLFNNPAIQKLLNDRGGAALPLSKVIQYDHLLRHTLQQDLQWLMQVLYETDVYITVSKIAGERQFTWARALPFADGQNRIAITNLYHPRVPGAVANSVYTNHASNMIFLTGANMAGKSTFMKSFGIAVYLAHMGFPVAAENMEFSVQDGIFTSINVPDNLAMGYSHFYAEVLRVKEVATAVSQSKNLVIIFDELFKGTNVKDAYDATVAVTEALGANSNVTFIVSTHIVEAGETLRERCRNMQFVFFPTIMDKQTPRYTYQLQEGISADRHGMMIITNEGIVDIIRGKSVANNLT
ncbi:DNA mismatch repair protein [Paraflavitalea soli]|uniref:DNA mismatch repair protein n=1 Tax=Paraflavitalea soli TaxID=2315862 RepID=A0A3B7MFJ9_9BACT|nr:DNA mismatch repair protein [Paraflavitalea soli]AXY73108.1 DNA mismatch repair protein [Paraflavitalea soli]